MVQSTCTSIWYIVLYIKQNRHGKETDPCYGFLLLGQWPVELWATHPHTHKKTTHIKNVFMHHTDHRDRSAGRPWCWHWSRFLKQQNTVLCLTRNDTQPKCLFLLCQIVPQSSFGPSACLSVISALSEVCVTAHLLFRVLIRPPSVVQIPTLPYSSHLVISYTSPAERVPSTINRSLCAERRPWRLPRRHAGVRV